MCELPKHREATLFRYATYPAQKAGRSLQRGGQGGSVLAAAITKTSRNRKRRILHREIRQSGPLFIRPGQGRVRPGGRHHNEALSTPHPELRDKKPLNPSKKPPASVPPGAGGEPRLESTAPTGGVDRA
jgi:hypothetical protein